VGAALLGAVIAEARSLGVTRLDLYVYPDNTAALRLYRSAGFQEQPDGTSDVLRMARGLS